MNRFSKDNWENKKGPNFIIKADEELFDSLERDRLAFRIKQSWAQAEEAYKYLLQAGFIPSGKNPKTWKEAFKFFRGPSMFHKLLNNEFIENSNFILIFYSPDIPNKYRNNFFTYFMVDLEKDGTLNSYLVNEHEYGDQYILSGGQVTPALAQKARRELLNLFKEYYSIYRKK